MHYHIYFDETCKNDNYLIYGGGIFSKKIIAELEKKIQDVKAQLGIPLAEEIKWTGTNKYKLELHKRCIDIIFDYIDKNQAVIIMLGSNIQCRYYSSFKKNNSPTEALSKMIYDLLKQGVFANYGTGRDIFRINDTFNLYVDEDSYIVRKKLLKSKYSINTRFSQDYCNIKDEHKFVKDLQIVDSKKHILMQLSDLIIGCVGAIVNGKVSPGTYKGELAEYLMDKLKASGFYKSTEELRRGSTPWKYKGFSYRIYKLCKSRSKKNNLGYRKDCMIAGKAHACP